VGVGLDVEYGCIVVKGVRGLVTVACITCGVFTEGAADTRCRCGVSSVLCDCGVGMGMRCEDVQLKGLDTISNPLFPPRAL